MEIFKKLLVLIVTLFVAMLPFGFSFAKNTNQTWHDLFGRGEALLLGVVFGADVLARSFILTKDRPTRLLIGHRWPPLRGRVAFLRVRYHR